MKTFSSFKFVQMKGHALFQPEIIVKNTCILTIYLFFFLQNHWANFNQTCAKHPCPHPFPRGDNSENTLTKFQNLLQNHWANLNQTWHKTFMDEQNSSLNKLVLFNSHKGDNSFFYRNQRYGLIIWLYYVVIDWNCFLGKRCGLFKD